MPGLTLLSCKNCDINMLLLLLLLFEADWPVVVAAELFLLLFLLLLSSLEPELVDLLLVLAVLLVFRALLFTLFCSLGFK